MKLPANHELRLGALALLLTLIGLTAQPAAARAPVPAPGSMATNGPAADYPMIVGAPYQIGNVTFTPADTMNYDVVGYASVGAKTGLGITAAHHTLPMPSYVEVTALDTGRTILVRVMRRGPMDGTHVIELSPEAAVQLGIAPGGRAAVRVRRVNPPESDRALLRAGGRAPERMETPGPLLSVLKRRLAADTTVSLTRPEQPSTPKIMPVATVSSPAPASFAKATVAAGAKEVKPQPKPSAKPSASPSPEPRPEPRTKKGDEKTGAPLAARPVASTAKAADGKPFVVQAGAFSAKAHAEALAHKIGGTVSPAGKLWRVRVGPFANRGEAEAALAKAKREGYSESRIQRAD